MSVWDKYKKIGIIGYGTNGNIYKCKDIKTKNYVAIKEILKKNSNDKYLKEIEIMKKIKNENLVLLKETFETKEYFYIVMELCICNLEEYIKMKENNLSINEIKQVLIQLNNILQLTLKEKIILKDLKPKNILISLDKLDKIIIKLSNYGSSKEFDNTMNIVETPLTLAPEILKGEEDLNKSDLWSIGIIIYYMYFKEYPYNGKNKNTLLNDINSGKEIKTIPDEDLNDLMTKLLMTNPNERLSWKDYFNHNFFNQFFNFKCQNHLNVVHSYCQNCKLYICESCLYEHNKNHKIINFNNIGIGLNNDEINKLKCYFKKLKKG